MPAPAFGVIWGASADARPAISAALPLLNDQIEAEINTVRAAHHLPAVQQTNELDASAAAHSREMIDYGFFAHKSRDGEAFWRRIERYYPRAGFRQWLVGETILWVSPDVNARTVVQDWLDSPPHREILLGHEWLELGVSALHANAAPGAFGGREATVVTADFGVRAD